MRTMNEINHQLAYCSKEMTALDTVFQNFDQRPISPIARARDASDTHSHTPSVVRTGPLYCDMQNQEIANKYELLRDAVATDNAHRLMTRVAVNKTNTYQKLRIQ